jgi:molybdopterin converting factor subunit 1
MRVSVKLFARLRDLAGENELDCDVADTATARDVWRALAAKHATLAPYESSVSCAINADYAPLHTRVKAGDEVAFLPPVSGG